MIKGVFDRERERERQREMNKTSLGPYSPTILKNILCLVLQMFLYLAAFECNTTSDWPIRSQVAFKLTKSRINRQRIFLKMVGECEP